ncbi:MAG: chemotaxis protein CheB [Polyangiales bacterium]
MTHDIVVIGASVGGLEVLLELVRALPKELPASLFIVSHRPASGDNELPDLLNSRGTLPAVQPLHGQSIERGYIYIAPPDNHLLVRQGTVDVVRGPKENGHRPAVDTLFRSAASAYGPRVIGVVLSGYQDCGTAGLMSIKARGGIAVAQQPDTALAADMPRSAIARADVDHIVSPAELPALLQRLIASEAGPSRSPDHVIRQLEGVVQGEHAELVCPSCSGVLTEAHAGEFEHFRCHVGHAFSLAALTRAQDESMERALWAAVRALEESAALSRRLSIKAVGELRRRFTESSATFAQQAETIRAVLLHGSGALSAVVVPQ